ncbi:hypothetical protein PVAP13_5KG007500 [Panicum virgatum]|uniref:KIB1-4 beta-propeller domain-containing protein n=1 Tax=Panicum virgatum TaxID=38727 RepID=A0A8T0SDQ3_PANVG|nr:hypothetical protein PVAP13_5KG007500 [Panicum virgatum]
MVPAEHATDDDDSSDELGKSLSPCLPLIVFQHHQSYQHENEHGMLMFSVSQKRLLPHAADMAPDLVAAGSNMFWTSPQGWMLVIKSTMSPSSSAAWLWNPRTGDKITLPDVERDDDGGGIDIPMDSKCLLTRKDATHPECFVVLFDRRQPNMWYCKVVVDDDGRRRSWRRYTYDIGDNEVPSKDDPPSSPPTKDVISSIAAVRGELFFISSHEDMCAIIFSSASDDPEFQYFDAAMVDFPEGMSSGITWLVESEDELFLVCVCFVGFGAGNIARHWGCCDALGGYKHGSLLPSKPPRAQTESNLLDEQLRGR